jgi:hypothetical protein
MLSAANSSRYRRFAWRGDSPQREIRGSAWLYWFSSVLLKSDGAGMPKQSEQYLVNSANPSRNALFIVGGLIVLVFFLTGLCVMLTIRYADGSNQTVLVALLVLLPLGGLCAAVWFIHRRSRSLLIERAANEIKWEIVTPESQRLKLNAEVRRLAALLKIEGGELADLRGAYILAEDLALRKIEQEKQLPLRRHVRLGAAEFDAVFTSLQALTFVEVMFMVTPYVQQARIDAILQKIDDARGELTASGITSSCRLLLTLVTQLDHAGQDKLRGTLVGKFSATPVDVDIRMMDFEDLQRIFTED